MKIERLRPKTKINRRVKQLEKLQREELSSNCAGWHVTSLDLGVKHLLERGYLPGRSCQVKETDRLGDFYLMTPGWSDKWRILDYGRLIGAQHYMVSRIEKLKIDKAADHQLTNQLLLGNGKEELKQLFTQRFGLESTQLEEIIKEAEKRKGVLLAISHKALWGECVVEEGKFPGDKVIRRRGGISIDQIAEVAGLGEIERQALSNGFKK